MIQLTTYRQKSPRAEKCTRVYGFGFNGQEKDDEVSGAGNSYDFGARMYDPRLGRFLSTDPQNSDFAFAAPYSYALNKPIIATDHEGERIRIEITKNWFGKPVIKVIITGKIINLSSSSVNTQKIAEKVNRLGNKWLSKANIDFSGINFGTETEPIYFENAAVQFDFRFEAIENMSEIAPDDHLMVLSDFDPQKAKEDNGTPANAVGAYEGLVTYVWAEKFLGFWEDVITDIGYNIALHEIFTHNLGQKHEGGSSSLTKGGGVNWWSNTVTDEQVKSVVVKTINGSLNKGYNTYSILARKYPVSRLRDEPTNNKEVTLDINLVGVDVPKTNKNAEKKQ